MKPNPKIQKKEHILVYWKLRDSANMQHVVDVLINNKLNFKVVKYGFYTRDEYHKLLLESKVCIWLGRHEYQGFAFQEALSYNVPLLVYDVLDMKEEVNDHNVSVYASYDRISLPATSAAFWHPICGEKTTTPKDIEALLKKMMGGLDKYRPREFVERELSDKVCFKRMLDRFGFS
jgi:glycosyltransferase involved in cell wall biosynthesis